MRKRVLAELLLILPLACLLPVCSGCSSGPVVLTIAGGSLGQELDLTVQGVERFMARNPSVRVNVVPMPPTTTERLKRYQKILAEDPSSLDVLQIDVVWPGIMAEQAVDLKRYIDEDDIEKHFPALLENNTVAGKLIGLPWFIDLPVLYYRHDLLRKYDYSADAPPKTWGELLSMSKRIQEGERSEGREEFWGYVWQGKAYEGLTCNALEWQYSSGGGNILDEQGNPTINNRQAADAFGRASGWVAAISPPESIHFTEDDAGAVWLRGDAAFMRNWTSYFARTRLDGFLSRRFKVARLPSVKGDKSTATLGGWQLMVSKHSRRPREAARLVAFLARESEQRSRAITGSFAPTIPSLYRDPAVLDSLPFLASIETMMKEAVMRPAAVSGSRYDEVSQAYWEAVHDILNGSEPNTRLAEAEKKLKEIMQR